VSPPKSKHLDHYATEVENLFRSARAADSSALKRLQDHYPEDRPLTAADVRPENAQLVVAREHGFSDWPKFKRQLLFRDAVDALDAGSYSWLEELLSKHKASLVDLLLENGEPKPAMEKALTWACKLGRTSDVAFLLDRGVDPLAGNDTGMNGFHYAVWHGHLDAVKLLLERKVSVEERNMYGGTVMGCAIHGVRNRPHPDHFAIIEALLSAGARMDDNDPDYPTGNQRIDELLRRHSGPK
jgi:hypothetical protein